MKFDKKQRVSPIVRLAVWPFNKRTTDKHKYFLFLSVFSLRRVESVFKNFYTGHRNGSRRRRPRFPLTFRHRQSWVFMQLEIKYEWEEEAKNTRNEAMHEKKRKLFQSYLNIRRFEK